MLKPKILRLFLKSSLFITNVIVVTFSDIPLISKCDKISRSASVLKLTSSRDSDIYHELILIILNLFDKFVGELDCLDLLLIAS